MKTITKELLEIEYVQNEKTVPQIAIEYGYKTTGPIYRYLRKYDIKLRYDTFLDYNTLYKEYVVNKKSTWLIGKQYGCNHTTVLHNLKRHGIILRTKSESLTEDLSGKFFGKLFVVKQADTEERVHWSCRCICGNTTNVSAYELKSGNTKTCGCGRRTTNKYITGTHFANIRKGAHSRNLEFDITIKDIEDIYELQKFKCALSGVVLNFANHNKKIQGNASVDRKDSNLGYVKNNIQIVHKDINVAKMAKSNEEFIELCRSIVNYNDRNLLCLKH